MADGAGDFFVFVRGERDGGDEADGEPGPFVCSVLVFAGVYRFCGGVGGRFYHLVMQWALQLPQLWHWAVMCS